MLPPPGVVPAVLYATSIAVPEPAVPLEPTVQAPVPPTSVMAVVVAVPLA